APARGLRGGARAVSWRGGGRRARGDVDGGGRRTGPGAGADRGQVDHEAAAVGRVVLDADVAAVIGDDLVDDGQPEPHPGGLGREVRQEDAVTHLGGDA